ncbi:hypothetical protein LUZ61_005649 [Rhynchospora tenuis]|uniref:UAS domain-containing protein n=1 Tax=Rhynchospora tenuis TaxID=198213 RepID=A0AAD5ZQ14_9POAL|nr:hypothetical protein LUZ61_005649 [Rhynchospora tenuis]
MNMAGIGGLVSSLVSTVTNLLPKVKNTFIARSSSSSAQQAPESCDVEANLRRLERLLKRIKATLYDAEERNIQDKSVIHWLKELKELGHEAKYILEEYMYEVYRTQVEAKNPSKLNSIDGDFGISGVYPVHISYDLADRIRYVKSRFEEIVNDREALCLGEEDAPRRKRRRYSPTPTSHLVVQQSIFGRDDEKEKIIHSLFLKEEGISVLPIIGMGGIGKTTMAQLIYNDERVQDSFDLVGWIYVSNDFNIERITRHIIEAFMAKDCNLKSPSGLIEEFSKIIRAENVSDDFNIERITQDIMQSFTRKAADLENLSVLMEEFVRIIRGKRIFLVLDDVWNEEPSLWESLRVPLMQATKATLLITTRNISVARIMQTMEPLLLEYLSHDKCWLLFTHHAFQGLDHANQAELIEIGQKIVKKCSGLPMAVKSIASLLSHEEEYKIWVEVLESDLWELDDRNGILAPLQISYEHLPSYLKPCLLLCSMFPKDYEYSMNLMSRLWIAHGYIEQKGRKPIEEVASDYTKMLYERSFFNDYNIKCDRYGLFIDATFRLHNMVHDLAWLNSEKTCCSVERGKQHFMSKEVCHFYLNNEQRVLDEPRNFTDEKLLRLSEMRKLPDVYSMNIMETLVMWFPRDDDQKQIILNIISKAKHLRALDLRYHALVLPFTLGNVKHLRYLSLSSDFDKQYERDILHNVPNFVAQISPEFIFSCYNLRYLILDFCWYHMELEGIGNLINLEFLQLFSHSLKLPESLGLLKKLRVLEIHKDKRYHKGYSTNSSHDPYLLLPECIGNLLELHRIVITGFKVQKLPESLCKLTNLKELTILGCILKELPENFGNLTSLQFLFLKKLLYFPLSCIKLNPNCTINICDLTMQPDNYCGAVGWLKDFNDLKGALIIQDIQNITSIADAKDANLIGKHKLETLSLLWNKMDYLKSIWHERSYEISFEEFRKLEWQMPRDYSAKKGILGISIGNSKYCKSLDIQDLDVLESFQPYCYLKHLDISSYHGLEFAKWMGDPLSCASLVKLWIRNCSQISSLPLGKLPSLKQLYIVGCGKLFHLRRESLPSKLKHLTVRACNSLVEIALLESLAELEVSMCYMLRSLSTVHLKMPEIALQSSEMASNHCNIIPTEESNSFPSLKRVTITGCPNLIIRTNQLVLAKDCEVNICYCNNTIKGWCFHHNYKYNSDEGLKRILYRLMPACEQHQMMELNDSEQDDHGQTSGAFKGELTEKGSAFLYQPPFALMYSGCFEQALVDAALQEKWLLVNIQSTEEFSSHMLNRDTWANETLSQIIRSNFLFWQVYDTMREGWKVRVSYNLVTLPAILLVDPITGQKMHTWIGMIYPDRLLEVY